MRQAIGRRVPPVLGVVLAVLAVWGFLTIVSPPFRRSTEQVREFLDVYVFWFPTYSLAWVAVLMLVSAAVLARKRVAWWLFTGLVLLALVSLISYTPDSEGDPFVPLGIAFQSAVLLLMLLAYGEFSARVRRGAFALATLVFVGGLAAVTAFGTYLVGRFPGTLPQEEALGWTIVQVAGLGLAGENYFSGAPPAWVIFILGALGAAVIIGATLTLFRSQRAGNALSRSDEELLRALIDRYGTEDSLAYFATRRDKSVVFSPDGLAALTYRVEVGVCLVSADPIGDPASWDGAITAWLDLCRRYGWAPAAIGASERGGHAYARHDLAVLHLGDEAVLHCEDFSLRGPHRDGLRQAVARARRAGVEVRLRRHAEVPPPELAHVEHLAATWRDTDDERGFSMALGRLGDPDDGSCLLVEARVGGQIVAFLSMVPWGRAGVSLDLMRRSPDAPNGTTDLMVAELCRQGPDLGIARLSLNFAVFRSVFAEGARLGAGPLLRMWRRVLLFLSRWWQLESLYRANDKYGPVWSPRYLAFADRRLTARIGLASGIAEGFVPWFGGVRGTHRKGVPASVAPIDASQLPPPPTPDVDVARPGQVRVRLAKVADLQQRGIDPWPSALRPGHRTRQALAEPEGTPVGVAGRVLAVRDFGGVGFLVVRDWSGDVQIVCEADRLGAQRWKEIKADLDLGDLVRVEGIRGRSRRGEESILADALTFDAKCLHPLPDKRKGLSDPEARVRQRYVDLAVRPQARDLARARSAVLRSLRIDLYERGYDEVETPMLQRIHGGANARPFETHINAYDLDLYLRIAPELYLKRLCVGGMNRVFEIGRAFRNEGVDFSHNPEFTILEAYESHGDYLTMMDLARTLIQDAARAVHGECVVVGPDGKLVDISGDWPVITLHDGVSEALVALGGRPITPESNEAELREACRVAGITARPDWNAGDLTLELYEHLCEKRTERPTFWTDFPTSVSPLTRSHRSTPGVTERWDLVAWGVELGTAYSELTDPIEQRRRLTDQSLKAADGDPEAMQLDEDFLVALEYGMPPTGGLGMGVDRVVMLVTGASIRETLPFPLARPHAS